MVEPSDIPFQLAESIYYLAVWVVAFLCGTAQTLRVGNYRSVSHTLNSGVVAGFLSFAIVAFVDGDFDNRIGNEFFYLGVSVVVGLTIDRQEEYTTILANAILKKLGFPEIDQSENEDLGSPSLQPFEDSDHGAVSDLDRDRDSLCDNESSE